MKSIYAVSLPLLFALSNIASSATISATPSPVIIPSAGSSGTTNLSWNAPGYSWLSNTVSVDNGPIQGFAGGGSSGSASVTWIRAGQQYVFRVYPALPPDGRADTTRPLALVNVTGDTPLSSPCNLTLSSGTNSTIQNALNSLPSRGVLCLSAGSNFSVTGTIAIPSNKTLQGLPTTSSNYPKLTATSPIGAPVISMNSVSQANIRGIEIIGAGITDVNAPGITVYNSTSIKINNVIVHRTRRMSIAVNGSTDVKVTKSYLYDMGGDNPPQALTCMWTSNSNTIEFSNNTCIGRPPVIQADGDGGTSFYNTQYIRIANNNYRYGGIYLAGPSGCQHVTISENNLYDTHEWAFDIVSGSSDVVVANNVVQGGGYGAAVVWNSSNINFLGNGFIDNNIAGAASCNGINNRSSTAITINSNNYITPGPATCTH